ncbi:FxLYD domain-containing protein [Halegenticoccus tardaugens]|uniref:FxLYD domain-containing protein n=1 Tax=Halegenticoccus tardaugens TaxID=2071624 RepID=UPI00100AEA58|nr:FxLYD domain-containing protein [Halegenticoccus tardaugens]
MTVNRRTYLALAASTLVAGCSFGSDGGSPTEEPSETPQKGDRNAGGSGPAPPAEIETVDHELYVEGEGDEASAYVVVELQNVTWESSGPIELTTAFFDADEESLDEVTNSLVGLDSGEVWEAYVPYVGEGAAVEDYEIDVSYDRRPSGGSDEGIELLDAELATTDYEASIAGKARNRRDGTIGYLEAHGKFYVDDLTVIASSWASVTDLAIDEAWTFDIVTARYGGWRDEISDVSVSFSDRPV